MARRAKSRILRTQKGATAVEFGLIAIPFFTMLFALLEVGVVFINSQILEAGLHNIVRDVRLGTISSEDSGTVSDNLCDYISVILDCPDGLTLDLRPYTPTLATLSEGGGTITLGNASQIMILRAQYKWKLLSPAGKFLETSGSAGYHVLASTIVFQNEPF